MRAPVLALALSLPACAGPYVVVLTDGTRVEGTGPVEVKEDFVLVPLPGGSRGKLPVTRVDLAATRNANMGGLALNWKYRELTWWKHDPVPEPPPPPPPLGRIAPGGIGKDCYSDEEIRAEAVAKAGGSAAGADSVEPQSVPPQAIDLTSVVRAQLEEARRRGLLPPDPAAPRADGAARIGPHGPMVPMPGVPR